MEGEYLYPASVDEALAALAQAGGRGRIMAGGTDLMLDLHARCPRPDITVDITRVAGLDRIEIAPDEITVGAAVTFAALQAEPELCRRVPALAEAAAAVGAAPIQALATWAGNIVQAMPGADGAVMAVALDAEARIASANGPRWAPVLDLYRGAGCSAVDPTREMLTHLRFRTPPARWGTGWRRLGRRPALVLPILNCAATLQLAAEGTIARATLAVGPVADHPWRATEVEAWLAGQQPALETWRAAGKLACEGCGPRSSPLRASAGYRRAVLPALLADALDQAARRACGETVTACNEAVTTWP